MSWPIQDLATAWLNLLAADAQLTSYDGVVPANPAPHYALSYLHIETADGTQAPDAVNLTFDSDVVVTRAIVHCVSGTPAGARGVAGRVRFAVLNKTLTVPNRACHPIRAAESQPPRRNEELPGAAAFDQVDVYSWRSVPA